jgi:hypothetical protein
MKMITLVAFLGGILGSILIHVLFHVQQPQAAEPCTLVEPAPIDAQVWLYRGLDACVSKCGPLPFDVEVEPQRVRCNCGRPPSLGVRR